MDATPSKRSLPLPLLAAFFFLSGFPALVYQLIWQRSLFAIYGINVESVTVIVAAFMLGLGLGSLVGGWVSARRSAPLLLLFALVELGIGGFGLCSLAFFDWVGSWTLGLSTLATGVVTFALVVLPTFLMGATLPLLVEYLVRRTGNVGRSVGLLYFVNTLGSAAACFAAALLLFVVLGQRGVVTLAAALNAVVAVGALVAWRLDRAPVLDAAAAPDEEPQGPDEVHTAATALPFGMALLLSGLGGFISLSYEILWFRVFSFAWASLAASFALLLGSYLAGIAVGSAAARRFCSAGGVALHALGWFVLLANAVGFLVAPLVSFGVRHVALGALLIPVAVAAGLLGAILPLVAHAAVPPTRGAGERVSYLYLANIAGSTSGSLLTGFVLMDRLPLRDASVLLALLGLGVGVAVLMRAGARRGPVALALALSGAALLTTPVLFDRFWERLQRHGCDEGERFAYVVENKSGVITVRENGEIWGGGAYDGVYSVDLQDDQNGIVRCYAVSALHPGPKRVLEVGLSSGSWAQVMVNHPTVESLTSIEINPGYLELISKHAVVASLLQNPKFKLVIDDGRRWLRRHPDERFDAIVMNTTFHWRGHATNLLSLDFLQDLRRHLAPGGIVIYNSTSSHAVQRTACEAFPHVARLMNFVIASNDPLVPDRERWRKVLLAYRIDGKPVVDESDGGKRLDEVLGILDAYERRKDAWGEEIGYALEPKASLYQRVGNARVITDDNMGTEWRELWRRLGWPLP
ncbi:MAG: methyltransferase domain-containing protein [Planctomycetota bacterium]